MTLKHLLAFHRKKYSRIFSAALSSSVCCRAGMVSFWPFTGVVVLLHWLPLCIGFAWIRIILGSRIRIQIKVKSRMRMRIQFKIKVKSQEAQMKPWRAIDAFNWYVDAQKNGADSHHFDGKQERNPYQIEKSDPHPDLHQRKKSDPFTDLHQKEKSDPLRIRIKVKSRIQFRIKVWKGGSGTA